MHTFGMLGLIIIDPLVLSLKTFGLFAMQEPGCEPSVLSMRKIHPQHPHAAVGEHGEEFESTSKNRKIDGGKSSHKNSKNEIIIHKNLQICLEYRSYA